jgi:hypothetical protein
LKVIWLPPAAEDVALAAAVNERLRAHAHVSFARKDGGEDGDVYVLVMEYFDQRKPLERDWAWFDADEVVRTVDQWIDVELPRYREADNWEIAH